MRILPPWLRLPPSWPAAAALATSPAHVSAAAEAERSNPGESRQSIRPPLVVFHWWLPRRLARRARCAPAHAGVIVGGPRVPRGSGIHAPARAAGVPALSAALTTGAPELQLEA